MSKKLSARFCISVRTKTGHTEEESIQKRVKKKLPDGESNPGLPRDRRGYSPLYYQGDADCKLKGAPFISMFEENDRPFQVAKQYTMDNHDIQSSLPLLAAHFPILRQKTH